MKSQASVTDSFNNFWNIVIPAVRSNVTEIAQAAFNSGLNVKYLKVSETSATKMFLVGDELQKAEVIVFDGIEDADEILLEAIVGMIKDYYFAGSDMPNLRSVVSIASYASPAFDTLKNIPTVRDMTNF